MSFAPAASGLLSVKIRTGTDNIYGLSRTIFFAFARRDRALVEMALKKADLEDIFIELTEGGAESGEAEK